MPSLRWLKRHNAATEPQLNQIHRRSWQSGLALRAQSPQRRFYDCRAICARTDLRFARKRFNAEIAEGEIAGARVMIIKPQAFMNLTRRSGWQVVRVLQNRAARFARRVR